MQLYLPLHRPTRKSYRNGASQGRKVFGGFWVSVSSLARDFRRVLGQRYLPRWAVLCGVRSTGLGIFKGDPTKSHCSGLKSKISVFVVPLPKRRSLASLPLSVGGPKGLAASGQSEAEATACDFRDEVVESIVASPFPSWLVPGKSSHRVVRTLNVAYREAHVGRN